MTYDVESLLRDVKTVLSTNLNTKINALNAEKNDSITLKTIPAGAYFLQELSQVPINYNPYVLYGEQDNQPASEGTYGATMENVTVSIGLILEDEGEDAGETPVYKMLRYRRALKEVIEENFQILSGGNKLVVQCGSLIAFEQSGARYRGIGINVTTSIG
jgi:hypothetical protein